MHSTGRPICALLFCVAICIATPAQNQSTPQPPTTDKPRVFITDSQSWEMSGSGGGANGAWGAQTHGGARPQTAETIKTFGERCPQVMVNNKQDIADYIVLLDHEGGKGWLQHKNKVAVFQKVSGDVVVSHSTMSLGGSVQDACERNFQRLVIARNADSGCCDEAGRSHAVGYSRSCGIGQERVRSYSEDQRILYAGRR
jgi:hypothetical protein